MVKNSMGFDLNTYFTGLHIKRAYTSLGTSFHNVYTTIRAPKGGTPIEQTASGQFLSRNVVYALLEEVPKLVYILSIIML